MHNTKHLLVLVCQIISKYEELEKAKGEKFNIFSILKLERNENRTHSAFIGELLNPKGSHLQGTKFLELFLEKVILKNPIHIGSTELTIEYHLGPRNDILKTGGRVDILIKDGEGNVILIENKIDASDQICQLERYCNYTDCVSKNIFYLNIFGHEPSLESKGLLESGKDFEIISYREHVLSWLEECRKEVADWPILRETIKQYILLIKKITNSMNNEAENEIEELMMLHYDEAKKIADTFYYTVNKFTHEIRTHVMDYLKDKLGYEFDIIEGSATSKEYAQIWIKFKSLPNSKVYFGVESFSHTYKYKGLDYGIFVEDKRDLLYEGGEKSDDEWYPFYETVSDFSDLKVDFSNKVFLKKILLDKVYQESVITHIGESIINYINRHKSGLKKYLTDLNTVIQKQ